jgi:hypothetical protein
MKHLQVAGFEVPGDTNFNHEGHEDHEKEKTERVGIELCVMKIRSRVRFSPQPSAFSL